jgi:hypothetical protein
MNLQREKLIRKIVLKALKASAPFMIEGSLLLIEINLVITPEAIETEFEEVLVNAESDRLLKRYRFGKEVKVKITDEGKAELQ